ncbi:hypothetical protein [Cryptosporangium sp. NPDC051539]|uniref:hypothetical protein n=1 Tax=Cryptosporangium sp. NPDC051539 TaxID=3363962 RepID=UPI0037A7F43D
MESLSRSDQAVLAGAIVVVCFVVALSLRGTRPGAPARIGAIVAGIAVILTLMVGMRANDLTNPRSDDRDTPQALHPRTAQAYGGATLVGDPQSGLTVHPPAEGTTGGAYLADAKFCDGRLQAGVHLETDGRQLSAAADLPAQPSATPTDLTADPSATTGAPSPAAAELSADPSAAAADPSDAPAAPSATATDLPAEPSATAGLVLSVRATADPGSPAALTVEYRPSEQEVRLLDQDGAEIASLESAATDPVVRIEIRGTKASVWFDGQRLSDHPVPVAEGCGAVRFGAWGSDAVLRNVVIQPV